MKTSRLCNKECLKFLLSYIETGEEIDDKTSDRNRSKGKRGLKRNAQFESGTVTHQTKKTTAQEQKGETMITY